MQTTMQDLTVILENRPGTLAKATSAIASAGINLEGGAGFDCGGEGIFHALFRSDSDAIAAKRALESAGFKIRAQKPVVVAQIEDKPGEAARIYRLIGESKVNLEFTYLATNTRLVIGADNAQKIADLLASPTGASVRR